MTSAKQEWASMWPLPLVAMLGAGGSACFAYASGAFLGELTRLFGWTRAEFSSAFTLQMLLGLVIAPIVGRLIDRIGPRRAALAGIAPFVIGISLLASVNGSLWQWWALCALQAVLVALVGPTVWMKAVAGRFVVSRGLAMAIALSGIAVGSALWPSLAAFYIQHLGWRYAFPALACSWGVLILPLTYFWFFGAETPAHRAAPSEGKIKLAQLVSSRAFVGLALGGAIVKGLILGLQVHMIPLLQGGGMTLSGAAALAGVGGLAGIVGRIATGIVLDIAPARRVALIVFMLPIGVSLLLLTGAGSTGSAVAAFALLGLIAGATSDLFAYLAARLFSQDVFASVYASLMAVVSVGASLGPLLAGACFDLKGSYDLYLFAIVPLALVATGFVALTPSGRKIEPAPALAG